MLVGRQARPVSARSPCPVRPEGAEPGGCVGRAVGEFVQCLPVLLTILPVHSKRLTLKKQRQEIMARSLLLLKDKFKEFSFSGKCFN